MQWADHWRKTVPDLLASVSSEEITEWRAFYERIYPIPDTYWQAGMIASRITNMLGARGTSSTPADWMPIPPIGTEPRRSDRQQTPEEGLAIMAAYAQRGTPPSAP